MKFNCERCDFETHTPMNIEAYQYQVPDGHIETLCSDCASNCGFCLMCNGLAAGADDDWLARHGVCYGCWSEEQAEAESSDEDYFEY
jgi:hypothetical protein